MRLAIAATSYMVIASFLVGCATPARCWNYSWGTVCRMDQNSLIKTCSPSSGVWDDGKPRPRWANVAGCYDADAKTIYLKDTCSGAMALTHELAHLDGVKNPEASGYDWDD